MYVVDTVINDQEVGIQIQHTELQVYQGMSQAPLKKGDGDPTSIVCRGQSTGMEDHRHEQESQNRDK